jgi:hypothetical protein
MGLILVKDHHLPSGHCGQKTTKCALIEIVEDELPEEIEIPAAEVPILKWAMQADPIPKSEAGNHLARLSWQVCTIWRATVDQNRLHRTLSNSRSQRPASLLNLS